MKLTIIKTLINNELKFEKLEKSILEISSQLKEMNEHELIILSDEQNNNLEEVKKLVENIKQTNVKLEITDKEYNIDTSKELVDKCEGEYILLLNGGDRLTNGFLDEITPLNVDDDLFYIKFSASNYKIKSKFDVDKDDVKNSLYNSNIIWEHVNNKLIKKELINNHSIDLSSALNDFDKQELFTRTLLLADNVNILNKSNYLKLQGNDEEFEMFEEYDDKEYFENISNIFKLIGESSVSDEEKNMLKASYFTFELLSGQNANKLQDTNKEEDSIKQIYLDNLVNILNENNVDIWAKHLSVEAQGIVRALKTNSLVSVANKLNLLLLFKEYENYKKKTDTYLFELENRKQKELDNVNSLNKKLSLFEEKVDTFNSRFNEVEIENMRLQNELKLREAAIEKLKKDVEVSNAKSEDYREKLIQAKELFTAQEEANTKLKGKINDQKVLVQEKEIEISRINLELDYLKSSLEESEKEFIKGNQDKLKADENIKEKYKQIKKEYNELNSKYQGLVEEKNIKEASIENQHEDLEELKAYCNKLKRENTILRNGYDDLAEELKLNRNIFKGIFKK